MMGALNGELFPTKILNKNSLSLVYCVLNRSFTVYMDMNEIYMSANLKYWVFHKIDISA